MMEAFPILTGPATRAGFARAFSDSHPGTDIFAPEGAPVVAVADGRIRHAEETKGGNVVYLVEPDGSQYFYGHLEGFAGAGGREVKAGDVIGFVGATGSAEGTPPHVHFEWRPLGGAKADPFPELTRLASSSSSLPVVTPSAPPKSKPKASGSSGALLALVGLFWLMSRKGGRAWL
jgi:murein DD-endopeptidase MepM/ murein hydrolase activator NlpD